MTLAAGENNNTIDAGFFKDIKADIDIEKYVKAYSSIWDYWKADYKDADNAPGPDALTGTYVKFKYVVTNPGETNLKNIKVTDDKVWPKAEEKWGYNVGDQNKDKLLNPGEKWIYTASEFAKKGLQTNIGTATGTPVDSKGNSLGLPDETDTDAANYTGVGFSYTDKYDSKYDYSGFITGDDNNYGDFDYSKYLGSDDHYGDYSTFKDTVYDDDHSFSFFSFADK